VAGVLSAKREIVAGANAAELLQLVDEMRLVGVAKRQCEVDPIHLFQYGLEAGWNSRYRRLSSRRTKARPIGVGVAFDATAENGRTEFLGDQSLTAANAAMK
jgi:hypothetical protein